MIKRLLAGAAAAAMMAGLAHAAEIRLEGKNADGVPVVSVKGDFIERDIERFADVTKDLEQAIISFSSNGGRLSAGIEIGTRIRLRGYQTVVADREECYSACALAWLGGATRFVGSGAQVGFHAAYFEKDGRFQETGAGNAVVGGYAANLGLSTEAIIFLTSAPPEGFNRLTQSLARRVGISAEFMPARTLVAIDETEIPANIAPSMEQSKPQTIDSPLLSPDLQKNDELYQQGFVYPVLRPKNTPEMADPDELYRQGFMYYSGDGEKQSYAQAARLFRVAAAQGHIEAQIGLGVLYENGHGVPQNFTNAVRWYRRAAAQGSAVAQTNLGNMYFNGWGVQQDHAEAVRLYRLAAAQGYIDAQDKLDNLVGSVSSIDLSGKWDFVSRCHFININGQAYLRKYRENEYHLEYRNNIGETAFGSARKNRGVLIFKMQWQLFGNSTSGSLSV